MKLYKRFNNGEYNYENLDEFIHDFSEYYFLLIYIRFLNNYDLNAKSNQKSEVLCTYLSESH